MMEISNMQQHQAMVSQLDQALSCPNSQQQQEKKPRPNPEQALKCPRCDSTNTKFCYYNNYSLTQPRYFCKGCRRYWTKGGTLRNVPVGGGCRKNKRSSATSSSKRSQEKDPIAPLLPPLPLPPFSFDPNDLSLAFAFDNHDNFASLPNPNPNPNPSFLDILRDGLNNNNINTNPSEGMYYGFGDHSAISSGDGIMMFPFDGGLMSSSEAVTTTTIEAAATMATNASSVQGSHCKVLDQGGESKVVMGLHNWPIGGDHGSLGLESARDYWNGVGSNWHGLINSSLM